MFHGVSFDNLDEYTRLPNSYVWKHISALPYLFCDCVLYISWRTLLPSMVQHFTPAGAAFVSTEWAITFFSTAVVWIRLYSRAFLTRSIGSDDFAILLAWVCLKARFRLDQSCFIQEPNQLTRGFRCLKLFQK